MINKNKKQSNLLFDKEKLTLVLQIIPEKSAFSDVKNVAKEKRLLKKKEVHVTLIGSKTGEQILEKIAVKEKQSILTKIQKLATEFTWKFSSKKEYYFISKKYAESSQEKEERKSIIQLIVLPDLILFYKKLNRMLQTSFAIPFPHLTLYTNSTNKDKKLCGIGLYSEEEFWNLKPVKIS